MSCYEETRGRSKRLLAICAVVAGLPALSSCAIASSPSGPAAGNATSCSDGQVTLLAADDLPSAEVPGHLTMTGMFALPKGGYVVSYDGDTVSAGEDRMSSSVRTQLVSADGDLIPVQFPSSLQDLDVSPRTSVVAVAPNGILYFFDDVGYRIISQDGAGMWKVVYDFPPDTLFNIPPVAVGPDGSLFIASVASVVRLRPGGPETVLGDPSQRLSEMNFGEQAELLAALSGPALGAKLPPITGMVIADNGDVYLSTLTAVLHVSAPGVIGVMLATTTADKSGLATISTPPLGDGTPASPTYVALAIDERGFLIVADAGDQRLLQIAGDTAAVWRTGVSSTSDGAVAARAPDIALVTFEAGGNIACQTR